MSEPVDPNVHVPKSALATAAWWGFLAFMGYGALGMLFDARKTQKNRQAQLKHLKGMKNLSPLARKEWQKSLSAAVKRRQAAYKKATEALGTENRIRREWETLAAKAAK